MYDVDDVESDTCLLLMASFWREGGRHKEM